MKKTIIDIFKAGRKCAEMDVTGWKIRDLVAELRVQRDLGRECIRRKTLNTPSCGGRNRGGEEMRKCEED